jgi:hypothetical protein
MNIQTRIGKLEQQNGSGSSFCRCDGKEKTLAQFPEGFGGDWPDTIGDESGSELDRCERCGKLKYAYVVKVEWKKNTEDIPLFQDRK